MKITESLNNGNTVDLYHYIFSTRVFGGDRRNFIKSFVKPVKDDFQSFVVERVTGSKIQDSRFKIVYLSRA